MSRKPQGSKDPDIVASAKALRRAARRALELGRATGTPVYVLKEGRIVDLAGSPKGRKRSPRSSPGSGHRSFANPEEAGAFLRSERDA